MISNDSILKEKLFKIINKHPNYDYIIKNKIIPNLETDYSKDVSNFEIVDVSNDIWIMYNPSTQETFLISTRNVIEFGYIEKFSNKAITNKKWNINYCISQSRAWYGLRDSKPLLFSNIKPIL